MSDIDAAQQVLAEHWKPYLENLHVVSVDKPCIRSIIGGKETKSEEFGAKRNNIQIDDISFIEHISFNAFNEGTRLLKAMRCSASQTDENSCQSLNRGC